VSVASRSSTISRGARFQKEIDQQFVERFGGIADLVVAFRGRRTKGCQFQPVQRAFAGQRRVQIFLPGQHPQQRILPQLLVVVQVFIAEGQPVNALRHHFFQAVRDPFGLPVVGEAASYAPQQADLAIRLAQQQCTTLGG
jgi:hypothetical protein